MSGKNIIFNDKNINKSNSYKSKKPFNVDDIDVNKILVSKKNHMVKKNSFKYFIGYSYNDDIRILCIKLPQRIGCFKYISGINLSPANENVLAISFIL